MTWARGDIANGRNGFSASGYVASLVDSSIISADGDETTAVLTGLSAGTAYKLWAIVDDGTTSSNSGVPQASASFTTYGSHPSTGSLSAQDATVAGTAVHLILHTTTGAISAQSAQIAGTANHPHTTTGALSAQAATVAGSAVHPHTTTGALSAQDAAVSGSAALTAGGTFGSTGALSAEAATVAGTAVHLTLHTTTGALSAEAATADGSAAHLTLHTSTGSLAAQEASVSGDSAHTGVVTHDATGALSAGYASISGSAQLNGVFVDATVNRGAPGPRRQPSYVVFINGKRHIGTYEQIEELIEEFAEEQAEKAVLQAKKPRKPRIVVQPGKEAKRTEVAQTVNAEAISVQDDMRAIYERAYLHELAEYEAEEEESLLAFL